MGCGPSKSKNTGKSQQKYEENSQTEARPQPQIQVNGQNQNNNQKENDKEIFVSTPARKGQKDQNKETASNDNIKQFYELGKISGSGQFGTVRISHSHYETSRKFAIKTIEKERMGEKAYMLRRELEILKTLDHPNVIKFYEIFQDEKSIHFVMEHCSGGDVYNSIISQGYFKEQEAAFFMQKIFSALAHMHSKNVIHRDLKPENLLFQNKNDDSEIKIIDFGLSRIFIPDFLKQLPSVVGTPLYVAPEVIEQTYYGKQCDNWSLGVVTFFILCGKEPFYAGTIGDVYNKIRTADFQFSGEPWDKISDEAKDMISKLLVVDPKKRMTAEQALKHPWFQKFVSAQEPNKDKIQKYSQFVQNILDNKCYMGQNQLRKEAIKIIINHYLTQEEVDELLQAFRTLDFDKNGELSFKEMNIAMDILNKPQKDKDLMKLSFQQMHVVETNSEECQDQQATIQKRKQELVLYQGEFLRSALNLKQYLTDEKLTSLFKFFDRSGNMIITKQDVKEIIAREGRKVTDEELDDIMYQTTNNKQGNVSFDQFKQVMTKDII